MNYAAKSELISLIDKHDIISFDVFDTLIHRLTPHAWSVPRLVELQLYYHDLTKTYPTLATSFAAARRNAERTSRSEREKFEGDSEVNFDEIYDLLQELLGIPSDVAAKLKELEIATERSVLYADPLIKEMFDYAKQKGKKVVICSDMYLPWTIIGYLIESCGYDLRNVPIYVSGDKRVSKYTGGLFDTISDHLDNRILHVGDNMHSDVEMAQRKGLDAFYYDYREYIPTTFAFGTSLTQSIIEGVITKLWLEGTFSSEELLGLQLYGPLLTGYLVWFLSKIDKMKYDHILFFARDAYLLFETINKHLGDIELQGERIFTKLPPIEYVHISRAAIVPPALFDIDLRKLSRLVSGREPNTVRHWLQVYGIDNAAPIAGELRSCGYDSDESLVTPGDARITRLLQQLYPQIMQAASDSKVEAMKYFAQFAGKRLAVIDLGWMGSVQQNLTKLLGDTAVDGYYFNLWNLPEYSRASLHDNYYAYLRDHADDLFADIPKLLQTGGVELLEDVFSTASGTTLGYFDGEPIVEEIENESTVVPQLQRAAQMFFDAALPVLRIAPLGLFDSINWMRPFFRMIEFPTAMEAKILGNIVHSAGAGSTRLAVPIAQKLDEMSLKDRELYKTAKTAAYWKQGFKLRNKASYGKSTR